MRLLVTSCEELHRIWQEADLTVIFVTHNVREAVRLGQRVLLMSSRPGMFVRQWQIDIEGPRRIESPGYLRCQLRSPKTYDERSAAMAVNTPTSRDDFADLEAGLDALDSPVGPNDRKAAARRMLNSVWPPILAIIVLIAFWWAAYALK